MDCQGRHLVGLDLGTSKVAVVVGQVVRSGEIEIIGVGVAHARGLRRGGVISQAEAVESIREAVEKAELTAGTKVDHACVSLSGTHIMGFNSRGGGALTGANARVTGDDIRRTLNAAQTVSLPDGRDVLHVLPQDFVVDKERGIRKPIGMNGSRLEANVHIVTVGSTTTRDIVACVHKAGVEVQELVLGLLAAGEAVLSSDEKELGVALVDIGAGTTDIAIFERGFLWHTAVIPIGGDHFTNDIAIGLRIPIPQADALKRTRGCALSAMVGDQDVMVVPALAGRLPRTMARRILSDFLQSRAEEMLHLVRDEISRAGHKETLNAGIVVTGGSANLEGLVHLAERIFDMPVRRGVPSPIGALADQARDPSLATAVGLVLR